MRKRALGTLALAAALAWPSFCLAADESVYGLWNVPGGSGSLLINEDGTFVGTRDDGNTFKGKWEISAEGTMSLVRDDGQSAKCGYTVTEDMLTFADCPIAGEYAKAE